MKPPSPRQASQNEPQAKPSKEGKEERMKKGQRGEGCPSGQRREKETARQGSPNAGKREKTPSGPRQEGPPIRTQVGGAPGGTTSPRHQGVPGGVRTSVPQ